MKKLFNVTGNDLFRKNVRKGIEKNKTIDNIKNEFKKYLCVSLYNNLKTKYDKQQLKKALEINDDILSKNSPDKFWFCHNGITIFSFDNKEFQRINNSIVLNPKKVSVVNGAQTLTSFFDSINYIRNEFIIMMQDMDISQLNIDFLLEEAASSIFLKTIFIHGKEENVSDITYGLNTQVPVLPEHIIADSEKTKELNKILKKGNVEIIKEGYSSVYNQSYNALNFAKKYLLCINKPGKSKNLRKSDLESILDDALRLFKKQEKEMIRKFHIIGEIDEWWKNSKKKREELYNNPYDIVFCKYGKNYFTSYVLNENTMNDDYYLIFENFLRDMKKNSHTELALNDFKKDELFSEYLISKKEINSTYINDDINLDNLMFYLNNKIKTNYSISAIISKYLSENNIVLDNFRVVNRIADKCCEAFPFPSSVFSEIYQKNPDYEENYLYFENSNFKSAIEKEFPLFVLDNIQDGNVKRKIVKISLIKNFSFKKYENDAKNVFEKTIQAFVEGDERMFPKVSDNIKFHVRPKAINANDTFEFSNGNDITKRTFWANKSLIDEMINNLINQSEN